MSFFFGVAKGSRRRFGGPKPQARSKPSERLGPLLPIGLFLRCAGARALEDGPPETFVPCCTMLYPFFLNRYLLGGLTEKTFPWQLSLQIPGIAGIFSLKLRDKHLFSKPELYISHMLGQGPQVFKIKDLQLSLDQTHFLPPLFFLPISKAYLWLHFFSSQEGH